ncbi:MAG: tRNA threonylcarbamoyladenosine dehydratase [Treponema sp.]|nr:tRNA threonylcarbamoyladenosine dehydratase [Treponema sp.]
MEINPFFQRLDLLVGDQAAVSLRQSRVIVFGLGGVGSWCAEALVRSGVGRISLVDSDAVEASNVNRQLQATSSTIGRLKTDALEDRLKDINPSCDVRSFPRVFSAETADAFDIGGADYVIDAIDSLAHKLCLIETAHASGARVFSSMGMAQKLDPTLIKTADIWKTHGCPLARLVRYGLRKRAFRGRFTAVYSPERQPRLAAAALALPSPGAGGTWDAGKKAINGTSVAVTATAGMVLASLVVRDAAKPGGRLS